MTPVRLGRLIARLRVVDIETDSSAGHLLHEDSGGQNLDAGSDEILSWLIVPEANDESLDVVSSVAEKHDSIDNPKLAEETFQHHLFLIDIWQVARFKQNLIGNRFLRLKG